MRFYQQQHEYYRGVDLHARSMHVCIVDHEGQTKVHKNLDAAPDRFLPLVRPYRERLVVAAECMFAWYWLADLCAAEQIAFVLGHALYVKAIHGGKAKNDRIDSQKITLLLKGGMLPVAYAYPHVFLIESTGYSFNSERACFQKCGKENAGGQIRAGERGVALVTIVEHGFIVLGEKALPG